MMQDLFVKPGSLERPGSGEDTTRKQPTGTSYQGRNKAPVTSTAATPHPVLWVRVGSTRKGKSQTLSDGLKELKKKQKWVGEMCIKSLKSSSRCAINSMWLRFPKLSVALPTKQFRQLSFARPDTMHTVAVMLLCHVHDHRRLISWH